MSVKETWILVPGRMWMLGLKRPSEPWGCKQSIHPLGMALDWYLCQVAFSWMSVELRIVTLSGGDVLQPPKIGRGLRHGLRDGFPTSIPRLIIQEDRMEQMQKGTHMRVIELQKLWRLPRDWLEVTCCRIRCISVVCQIMTSWSGSQAHFMVSTH